MTKQLKWRLGKLPTPDEVLKLVNDKLITKEEAREILFTEQNTDTRDEDSFKEEIKFLRELVEKLSNKTQVIETIRTIEKPYYNWGWYAPYQNWCYVGTSTIGSYTTSATALCSSDTTLVGQSLANTTYCSTNGTAGNITSSSSFSDIQTF